MTPPEPTMEERILRLVRDEPGLTVRELAQRLGTDRDTVKPVLVKELAETGGTRLPVARRSINRIAQR